jgi:hypothetical protein
MVLLVIETYFEMDKKTKEFLSKEREVGEITFKMKDIMANARTTPKSFHL